MIKYLFWRCTVLLLLLLHGTASGSSTIDIPANLKHTELTKQAYYFVDSSNALTLEQVQALPHESFNIDSSRSFRFDYGYLGFWFKLNLHNNSGTEQTYYLELDNPRIHDVQLYYEQHGQLSVQKSGTRYPFSERGIYDRVHVFTITLLANETKEVYVYAYNNGNYLAFPIHLWSDVAYLEYTYRNQFSLALYYGILLLIIAINLYLLFTSKNKVVLFYLLYIVCFGMTLFTRDGYGIEFFYPSISYINPQLIQLFILLTIAFNIQFLQDYLKSKIFIPGYHTFLNVLKYTSYGLIVFLFIPTTFDLLLVYVKYYVIFANVAVVTGAGVSLKKNFSNAMYYLTGFSLLFIGVIITVLIVTGVIENKFLESYGLKIASVAEIIVLTIAMVTYIKRTQAQTQQLALERLKEINELNLKAKEEERKQVRLNEQLALSELKALRSQMNPHFIFNTMNTIQYYVSENDQKTAQQSLSKLAKLMRMILEHSELNVITIEEELKALELYIQLEAFRFEKKFSYEIIVDESISPGYHQIPSMLIQPYVENSIWHGLMHKHEEDGRITITLIRKGDVVCCAVEDNGIGREQSQRIKSDDQRKRKSMGMQITKERLELLSAVKSETPVRIIDLKDENGMATGTRVELEIPIQ